MAEPETPINATTIPDQPAAAPVPESDISSVTEKKWAGWPGDCVFRVIVPVLKVGSIIGRKGDLIKKMCEQTKARIRVLDGPVGNPDRIILISGKEETEAPLSPAMDAVIRVFKRVNGFPEDENDGAAAIPFCSFRLLLPSTQAASLIGKQGSSIKTIQETGCSVRVVPSGEITTLPTNSEDKVVDLQGEALKVLKALEAVVGHLRKFLVDHSVLPLFEQTHNATATQEHQAETWAERPNVHLGSRNRVGSESLFLDREPQQESRGFSSGLMFHGRDPGLSTVQSPLLGLTTDRFVTQVAQTMQIPLVYAEDIIGVGGRNITYIRQTSGALLTVQEGRPDEIVIEMKGSSSQVQAAQQLIQDCVNNHNKSIPSDYSNMDLGARSSSYSGFIDPSYSRDPYDFREYSNYRM
ncbi:putative K domain-containing protein [Helianthus annuus]|uniref:K domain-containing protein n=1 Tax=Helianthus annuus TaxID=4232 RepID=A0A251TTJ6_HELAN|nr:RNA-binding KH domain-containing protein PEPPER [Helianthus annuus]KAF5789556.1 putative K domain-containing protein [Helianthus annuus]KAJ0532892.1 putative K domain-containing protein [Helianthus annuus]KAJ0541288.1 putative K domain-containing protein [Helianthus annuus]KAJ0706369.1 putative K domain-containing protein [Helianthus annuus]KAJ0886895.1 putative K domain-containing protein [Helianthus annuus]